MHSQLATTEVSETEKPERSRGTGIQCQRRTKSDGSEAHQHSSRQMPRAQRCYPWLMVLPLRAFTLTCPASSLVSSSGKYGLTGCAAAGFVPCPGKVCPGGKRGTGLSFTYSQNSMTGEVAFSLVTLSVEFAFWSSMQFPAGEAQGEREHE